MGALAENYHLIDSNDNSYRSECFLFAVQNDGVRSRSSFRSECLSLFGKSNLRFQWHRIEKIDVC